MDRTFRRCFIYPFIVHMHAIKLWCRHFMAKQNYGLGPWSSYCNLSYYVAEFCFSVQNRFGKNTIIFDHVFLALWNILCRKKMVETFRGLTFHGVDSQK